MKTYYCVLPPVSCEIIATNCYKFGNRSKYIYIKNEIYAIGYSAFETLEEAEACVIEYQKKELARHVKEFINCKNKLEQSLGGSFNISYKLKQV